MSPAQAFLIVLAILAGVVAALVIIDFVQQAIRKRAERKRRESIDEWEWETWG